MERAGGIRHFGHVTFLAVVTGWLLSLIPAFWLARGRMIELEQIRRLDRDLPGADQRWRARSRRAARSAGFLLWPPGRAQGGRSPGRPRP
ncbi:MAG: hypothetical protein U1E17_04840 [Geminicoccaceae bacterium]